MDWLLGARPWVRRDSKAISPTAHYTGYVWARHGLGDSRLATSEGRWLFTLGQVVMLPVDLLGGPTLEHLLLARHRVIDRLLAELVETGQVTVVVELACGMSPRGLDFARTYRGDLTYVEVNLPGMASRKRAALARVGGLSAQHRVESADVFDQAQLTGVFDALDPAARVAVVTEGLLSYFDRRAVEGLWHLLAANLGRFPLGVYLSDLHLSSLAGLPDRAFAVALGALVRGKVHLHFGSPGEAEEALLGAGFRTARLHAPHDYSQLLPDMETSGADRVRVLEARVGAAR